MNISKRYLALALALSASGGYLLKQFTAHKETVTVEKEVSKDRIVTIVRTVKAPDGTVTRDRTTTEDRQVIRDTTQVVKEPPPLKDWHISASYNLRQEYGLAVHRRILGPVFIGAQVDTSGAVGVSLAIEF